MKKLSLSTSCSSLPEAAWSRPATQHLARVGGGGQAGDVGSGAGEAGVEHGPAGLGGESEELEHGRPGPEHDGGHGPGPGRRRGRDVHK